MRHVDIFLQRIEVWHQVGIAIVIVLAEDPAEALGRLFCQLGRDFGCGVVVLRIEIPVQDAQRVFEKVDQRRAMGVDKRLAGGPHDELRSADCGFHGE